MRRGLLIVFGFLGLSASLVVGGMESGRSQGTQNSPGAQPKTWNFDSDAVNQLPAGFMAGRTGNGSRGNWHVMPDPTAPSKPNVLIQKSADETEYRFPVAFVKDSNYKDLKVGVRFKILSGKVDQAAGLLFRSGDDKNYYLLRASALEKDNQFRLYHVIEGRRTTVAGVNLRIPLNEWHSMSVEVKENHFRCYFDDQLKFETDDKRITRSGRIGVWTRADSVACFDDLTVQ